MKDATIIALVFLGLLKAIAILVGGALTDADDRAIGSGAEAKRVSEWPRLP